MKKSTFISLSLLAFLPVGLILLGQNPVPTRTIRDLEHQSRNLRPEDTQSVSSFTNAIVSRSIFRDAQSDVRDQLALAEIDYRQTGVGGVDDVTISDFVNQAGSELKLPGFTMTSVNQVKVMRALLFKRLPSLLGPSLGGSSSGQKNIYSPSGAFFLSTLLLEQKLINPDYQRDSEEWAMDTVAKQEQQPQPRNQIPRLSARVLEGSALEQRDFVISLNSQLRTGRGPAVALLRSFTARLSK